MRKLIVSIILSFVLLLPFSMVAKPLFAQEDSVTTTTLDSSYYDDYYDDYYYDSSYYTTGDAEEVTAAAALAATLFTGIMLIFSIVIGLSSYIYCSLALMKIAKRLNHANPWFAWVPILNLVLIFQLGDKNPMLLLLMLIPGIGAVIIGVISIIALMTVCEKRGHDKMLGLLSLVPVANYILLGILAWGKDKAAVEAPVTKA